MTDKDLRYLRDQFPEGEEVVRWYRAIEGDERVITRDPHGEERRYTIERGRSGSPIAYRMP